MTNRLVPKAQIKSARFTVKQAVQIMNEAASAYGTYLRRSFDSPNALNADPRRDIDKECGYLADPKPKHFKEMWEGFGLAARVVNLMPQACFSVKTDIYETERPRDTPFEKKVNALISHPDISLLRECQKADALSRLGEFGGIYLGFDDGSRPDRIAPGLNEDGTAKPRRGRPRATELLYMTAMDQTILTVKETENDQGSRRYGLPKMYEMVLQSKDSYGTVNEKAQDVHWSRIVHVAECEGASKWLAIPMMKRIFPQLLDVRKILGGSAEMFWKGGFPGIAATVDPRFIEAGVEVNDEEVSEDMQRYLEGLQRSLVGVGFQYTQLSPGVADPTQHLMMQFQVIATSIGVPLRVFLGSEEAKLASGQDAKAWNSRVAERQNNYLTHKLIKPLINRLIYTGVVPPPKNEDVNGFPDYKVFWPDVARPDADETSTVADRRAASLMKYVTSKAYQVMQPSDFLRFVLGYEAQEVAVIMENAKKEPEIVFAEDVIAKAESEANIEATKKQATAATVSAGVKAKTAKAKKPADSGVGGKPPSDKPANRIK